MDYRKDVRTPRDRVDDDLLRRLLNETDEILGEWDCGNGCGSDCGRSNRSPVRNRSGANGSCGCGRSRNNNDNDRDGSRRTNGCGCDGNARRSSENGSDCARRNNGCGCDGNARKYSEHSSDCARRNSGCGCDGNARRSSENGCGCGNARENDGSGYGCIDMDSLSIRTQGLPHVMSYAPDQEFCKLHEDEEALEKGTLFHELYFPFYPTACDSDKKGCGCGCND